MFRFSLPVRVLRVITVLLVLHLGSCAEDCIKSSKCKLEPDPGFCKAYFPKYYYDPDKKKCEEFIWGGCDGVVPFDTIEECEKKCDCS